MSDVKFGEILLPNDADTHYRNERDVREKFWPKLIKVARKIPFARDAAAAYYCALDKNTSLKTKGVLFASLAYFVMPIDILPDVFVLIGFTDDLAVLTAAFALVRSSVKEEHYKAADEILAQQDSD